MICIRTIKKVFFIRVYATICLDINQQVIHMKKPSMLLLLSSVVFLTGCPGEVLSDKEVADKVAVCKKSGQIPWYTFVKQGQKESGVLYVECRTKESISKDSISKNPKKESSLFDDDTPVTSGGMPSMSGLPGGPF